MASVTNPYSKRKPPPPEQNNATAQHGSGSAAPTASVATFSQAFESIEDTQHYKNQLGGAPASMQNQEEAKERSEQRSFDAQAAQQPDATSKPLSDRDHHVWLQPHVLYVSTRQRGNGVLNYIRNVPYQFSRMVPDYIFSATACALFLSCRYHSLYPNYIHKRLAELKTDFTLRVLLVLVDVEDNAGQLLFLNHFAVTNSLTLILAWSEEEAARYLETFKALDGRDASLIQKKEKSHFGDQVADFLGTCKGVNKTDAAQLLTQFTNVRSIAAASMDELGLVSGMGEVKVKRLHDAFHKPFSSKVAAERQRQREEAQVASGESSSEENLIDREEIENEQTAGENETALEGGI